MLSLHVESVDDVAIVECRGRIVRSEAAFKLRDAVISQSHARVIWLDLSEVSAIEGGGLGMLLFLQKWAQSHNIQLKLFNPVRSVKDRLTVTGAGPGFEVIGPESSQPSGSQEQGQ
jgi:anti-anti-sigma factor